MGAYLFSDCKVGELKSIHDLNTLKHISTTADDVSFHLNDQSEALIEYALEFFKYLYQKSPFTLRIQRIKASFGFDVVNENDKGYSMLLCIEQYLNKYVICRKFNQQRSPCKSSSKSISANIHNIVKIDFGDVLYRIKTIYSNDSNKKIMNYFGLLCLKGEFDNEVIKRFYLNREHAGVYDHLVPCCLVDSSMKMFVEYFPKFIAKHKVTNIKFPPFVFKGTIAKEEHQGMNEIEFEGDEFIDHTQRNDNHDAYDYLPQLFQAIESIPNLNFVDVSLILYISSINDIYDQIGHIIDIFPQRRSDLDYILRFYLFSSHLNLYSNLSQCKSAFKKAIVRCQSKRHSLIMMNIFRESIIKCDQSPMNPRISDDLIHKHLDAKEEEYHKLQQTEDWHHRNRPETHSEWRYSLLSLSSSMYRIYSTTQLQINYFLFSVYSNNELMRKLRPKTIISNITRFISVDLITEECRSKRQRSLVFKKQYDNQIENVIPIVKYPHSPIQLHQDLVHCHYDHIYNLLSSNALK